MFLYIKIPGSNQVKMIKIVKLDVENTSIQFEVSAQDWLENDVDTLEDNLPKSVSLTGSRFLQYQDDSGYLFSTTKGISTTILLDLIEFLSANTSQNEIPIKDQEQQKQTLAKLAALKTDLTNLNQKNKPTKHKKNFTNDNSVVVNKVEGLHSHSAHIVERTDKKQRYVLKLKSNHDSKTSFDKSAVHEFTAFASQLARYALGAEYVANTRVVVDENEMPVGTRQKEIKDLNSLEQLLIAKKFPTQEELIKAGLGKKAAVKYCLEEDDDHSGNDSTNRLYDFDHWLSPMTSKYHGFPADQSRKFNYCNKEFAAPNQCFDITQKDLKSFPVITDAKPINWLFAEGEYRKNPVLPYLKGIEKKPEVKKQAYKTFLRLCLLEESTVEKFAEAHVRVELRKELVDHVINRLKKLKTELLQVDEFKCFLADNPHDEILAELTAYNDSFKRNKEFKVDIDRARNKLKTDFSIDQDEVTNVLGANFAKLTEKFAVILDNYSKIPNEAKDFLEPKINKESLQIRMEEIQNNINHWPNNKMSALEMLMRINSFSELLSKINTELNSKLENIKIVSRAYELSNQIENLHGFYSLDSSALKKPIIELQDKISKVIQNFSDKPIAEIKNTILAIELSLNQFFIDINKFKNPKVTHNKQVSYIEHIVEIKGILSSSRTNLYADKSKHMFLGLQHEWHYKNILKKCLDQTSKIDKIKNVFQYSILIEIKQYLEKAGKKTPYYRLKNIQVILGFLNPKTPDNELKKTLNNYMYSEKFTIGRLPISNLRHAIYNCIQEHDRKEYLNKYVASPAA